MGLFDAIDVAGTGLAAQRLQMDVTAGNLANAETTRGANGQPYQRREVVLQEAQQGGFGSMLAGAQAASATGVGGVQVAGIVADPSPPRRVYDPGHPDADAQGYVSLPNVNPVNEMVDLISASRSYEADVTAMQAAKTDFTQTLGLLK
jgi:flagellar basal-body rod protein FlgC